MRFPTYCFLLFFLVSIGYSFSSEWEDPIERFKSIIEAQIKKSLHHTFTEDAFEHRSTIRGIKRFEDHHFIIIGAGAAGAVLANRLSRIADWKILLLEAGEWADEASQIPNLVSSFHRSRFDWSYRTIPQKTSCLDVVGRRCFIPHGKGLGGSTLINGAIYSRGHKFDFDKWGHENPGWSFRDVLPFFKRLENFVDSDAGAALDPEFHGVGGELNVAFRVPRDPFVTRWLKANEEMCFKHIDYNGKEHIGAGVIQFNIKHGRRQDTGTAFLAPIRHRNNLNILTRAFVTKVIIDKISRVARGVRFVLDGQTYHAYANNEVILSAGVIASAQLLMLSGIGPSSHLRRLEIPVLKHLEVGTAFQDHPMFFGLNFNANYRRTDLSLDEDIKDFLKGEGPLTTPNNFGALGFYQTKFAEIATVPDVEILAFTNHGFLSYLAKCLSARTLARTFQHLARGLFALNIIALHPKSVGTIRLKSNNPFDYPLIDSKFLSDPEDHDIKVLVEGIKLALSLVRTEAFRLINASLIRQIIPECAIHRFLSDEYWFCHLRHHTSHGFHAIGTNRMGPDPLKGAVVDAAAKVHGIRNLRVADASIIPFPLSGHLSAPCIMIGEKVADLIIKHHFERSLL